MEKQPKNTEVIQTELEPDTDGQEYNTNFDSIGNIVKDYMNNDIDSDEYNRRYIAYMNRYDK